MNSIELAEYLHKSQEELEIEIGIQNKIINFKDLPYSNKILLIKLANKLIERFNL
jgi:hypothetical protein